jgi:hypothetical protein
VQFEVFFSHATEDKIFVDRIFNILRRIQINCYVIENFPPYGEILQDIIKNKICECNCMLVLLTKKGIESQWVNQEIGIAHAYGKLIIPIVEEGIKSKGFVEFRLHIKHNSNAPDYTISQVLYSLRNQFPNKTSFELECEKCGIKQLIMLPTYDIINDAIRKNGWLSIKCYSCDNYNLVYPETLEQSSVYSSYQSRYQSGGVKFL